MKKKRITSLALVMVLLLSILSVSGASAAGAAQPDPVSLMYAQTVNVDAPADGAAGKLYYTLSGYVEVENIAYDKQVTIVYSADGETWSEAPAQYFKPTWGNKQAWSFTTDVIAKDPKVNIDFQFAVKYEVNGATYWDNNNGYNYWASTGDSIQSDTRPAIGNAGIFLRSVSHSSLDYKIIHGGVYLKNLGYEKDVKMRYTTDNWATYSETNLTYSKSLSDEIEWWTFSQSIPSAENGIEVAFSYTVNGTTYWDNNFGDNYTVPA